MTYTVLGRCHRTGRLGIGIATFSITVGRYCYGVKSNAGVTVSQAFANERNNALALRLLTQGFTARSVLQQLMENDPYAEYRQIGVIDRSGMAVAHTGPHTRGWSGHVVGENYVAFGNGLVGPASGRRHRQRLPGRARRRSRAPPADGHRGRPRRGWAGHARAAQGRAFGGAAGLFDGHALPTSTCASICMRRRSRSCGASGRNTSSTKPTIATASATRAARRDRRSS